MAARTGVQYLGGPWDGDHVRSLGVLEARRVIVRRAPSGFKAFITGKPLSALLAEPDVVGVYRLREVRGVIHMVWFRLSEVEA